jgi:hypothetical protein
MVAFTTKKEKQGGLFYGDFAFLFWFLVAEIRFWRALALD